MGDDIPVPKPIVAVPAAVVVYPGKDWPLIEVQRVLHRERQMGSLGRFGNVEKASRRWGMWVTARIQAKSEARALMAAMS